MSRLPNPPSYVKHGDCEFLIMDAPTDQNLPAYIAELKKRNVKTIVRACEPTYSSELLQKEDMKIIDVSFPDGQPPSDELINQWLKIVQSEMKENGRCVAVHCVAGLGRAPVLVAIALIEIENMDPLDAIDLIRKARRGAINQRQFNYLKKYQPQKHGSCCIIV